MWKFHSIFRSTHTSCGLSVSCQEYSSQTFIAQPRITSTSKHHNHFNTPRQRLTASTSAINHTSNTLSRPLHHHTTSKMLYTSVATLLLLLTTSTSAAPTRTHCRCTIVADSPPAAIYTPSAAHWTPAELLPTISAPPNVCAHLGPQLEHFQRTEPDLYESYVSKSDSVQPGKSNVLVNFPSGNELRAKRREDAGEPRPTSRPHQRIVCHSESEPFTAYQDTFFTLWVLQVVVGIAVLACAVEGVNLCLRWSGLDAGSAQRHSAMRIEISEGVQVRDEKRAWGQQVTTPLVIVQAPNGERVCITYEEDEDDEANRPVM
jgi:hypothetical protein